MTHSSSSEYIAALKDDVITEETMAAGKEKGFTYTVEDYSGIFARATQSAIASDKL